ncbi:MazF family transcriptional regulator [Arcobacter sp. FW59]|nr:MazF family transcriptional regulator [Arcobacter sp. FW59]
MKRGEIYLVNFGKKYNSEFGKIRPALIIQNDIANRNIDKVEFKGVTVIPITTNLCGGNLRVKINSRESLKQDSEICINELCTLDLSRIDLNNKLLTLNKEELEEVQIKLISHLGL